MPSPQSSKKWSVMPDLFNCRTLRTIVAKCLDEGGGDMLIGDLVAACRNEMTYAEQRKWEEKAYHDDVKTEVPKTKHPDPLDDAYNIDGRAIQTRFMDEDTAHTKFFGVALLGADCFDKVHLLVAAYNAEHGTQLDADEIIREAQEYRRTA